MNISMKEKQTHRHREQTCQGGWRWGREGLGVQDYQIQTSIQRMDKQQGPTVQHRELYSISVINHNVKVYMCISEKKKKKNSRIFTQKSLKENNTF